jgi:hypothetical protein
MMAAPKWNVHINAAKDNHVRTDDIPRIHAGEFEAVLQDIPQTHSPARCRCCLQPIVTGGRIAAWLPYVQWNPIYIHQDEATCLANLEAHPRRTDEEIAKTEAKRREQQQIRDQEKQARMMENLMSPEELRQAAAEPNGVACDGSPRRKRRAVVCLGCGELVNPTDTRWKVKLHDPATHWTIREGFLCDACGVTWKFGQ